MVKRSLLDLEKAKLDSLVNALPETKQRLFMQLVSKLKKADVDSFIRCLQQVKLYRKAIEQHQVDADIGYGQFVANHWVNFWTSYLLDASQPDEDWLLPNVCYWCERPLLKSHCRYDTAECQEQAANWRKSVRRKLKPLTDPHQRERLAHAAAVAKYRRLFDLASGQFKRKR